MHKYSIKELEQRIKTLQKLVKTTKDKKELLNYRSQISDNKRKIRNILEDNKRHLVGIDKEIYFDKTTTTNYNHIDITKYKKQKLLNDIFYVCDKCGALMKDRYVDVFDITKQKVCKECNEKYFGSKLYKIN